MKTENKVITIPDFMFTMLAIKDNPGSSVNSIHYQMRITYSHLHLIKKMLVEKGWVTIEKDGIKHILSLTPKGEDIVESIVVLFGHMGYTKNDIYKLKLMNKTSDKFDKQQERVPEEVHNN